MWPRPRPNSTHAARNRPQTILGVLRWREAGSAMHARLARFAGAPFGRWVRVARKCSREVFRRIQGRCGVRRERLLRDGVRGASLSNVLRVELGVPVVPDCSTASHSNIGDSLEEPARANLFREMPGSEPQNRLNTQLDVLGSQSTEPAGPNANEDCCRS
jgi:hypothetical protein